MGTSRLLDELSKSRFMIPINLRKGSCTGLFQVPRVFDELETPKETARVGRRMARPSAHDCVVSPPSTVALRHTTLPPLRASPPLLLRAYPGTRSMM